MPKEKSTASNGANDKIKRIDRIVRRIIFGGFGFAILLCLIAYFFVKGDLPPMGEIEAPHMDLSTQIYSADGVHLGNFHSKENRIHVDMEEISPNVRRALLATEDIRFESHSGIDPKMPFTLMKDLIIHFDLRGGSSISQQLARNLYDQVGRDNSLTRKIKEAIVAVILESRFTKSEIMEAYLNSTCFYGNTYGIEMGARTLFNKSAKDLDVHEAALMVGLLKSPTYYSPTGHPDRAVRRRNTVIEQMQRYDLISDEKAAEYKAMDLGLKMKESATATNSAAYFKDEVKRFLKKWAKEDGRDYDLYTDGLRVYTTVDSRMQKYAELAVREHMTSLQTTFNSELKRTGEPWKTDKSILEFAKKMTPRWYNMDKGGSSKKEIEAAFKEKHQMRVWDYDGWHDTLMSPEDSVIHYMRFLETGFMAMDPKTGDVKAWVGGINYDVFKLDHVSQAPRQVGSTFKPFVYAAALDMGLFKPCDKVLDIPVSIELPDGRVWTPSNSSGGSHGDGAMTYLAGLAQSKNQVTARLMKEAGEGKVCEYAYRFGIEEKLQCVPSLCLGTTDLTLLDMLGGYNTFANYGNRSEPRMISRIEDKFGNVIAEFPATAELKLDSADAYSLTQMLMGVVDQPYGTAHRLRGTYKFTNQIAGKTGTTQNNSDGWFIGYTPNIVAGAWVGNADRRVRFRRTLYGQGANMALPIWAIFMKYVQADKKIGLPSENFSAPANYDVNLVCPTYKDDGDGTDPDDLPEFGG